MRRKANRRHMTGDRGGQAAVKATLLVRAVDGILGTHRSGSWLNRRLPHFRIKDRSSGLFIFVSMAGC
jgi:uncharacterized protein (DUF2384 family)